MTEANIYQRALANAIEQAANSQIAVREHLRRLAFMKSERIYKACIGNEYHSRELGTVKAVAVGYEIKENVFVLTRYNTTRDAIRIKIVFATDVQALLDSKRKQLTDAERKGTPEWEAYHTFNSHGIFERFRDEMYDRMYNKKSNTIQQ